MVAWFGRDSRTAGNGLRQPTCRRACTFTHRRRSQSIEVLMPFSRSVKVRALLDAARHCCLCRRYKGVKVEVHHIIPQAKGGSNASENAIALCFDCHADAGAYNPEHPRGTKITPDELRCAREEWHEIVRSGAVQARAELNLFYCRYIVGKSFSALREVVARDLRYFPVANPLLVETPALAFLRSVIRTHAEEFRWNEVQGNDHNTAEQYQRTHVSAEIRPTRNVDGFEYFTFERVPSREELLEHVAPRDGITRLLLQAGIPNQQIARALAYEDGCGSQFPETFRTRPLWGVFLAITNVSQEYVEVLGLEGSAYGEGLKDLISIHSTGDYPPAEIPLPKAPLAPGNTVIIPVSTVLGPLDHFSVRDGFAVKTELGQAHWQTFAHVTANEARTWASFTWGPAFFPQQIKFTYGGFDQYQSVHELNVSNVYEIDRHWGMGSCPHVFGIDTSGKVRYLGEVLAKGSNNLVTETLRIPSDAVEIVIAELEEETTYLNTIKNGAETLLSDRVLTQGEFVVIRPSSAELTVEGFYIPSHPAGTPQPVRRNELVGNFREVLARLQAGDSLCHPTAITAVAPAE